MQETHGMQVTVEEVNPTRRKLAVEVPVDEVRAEIDEAFGKLQRQAKLRGFRPGKAPRAVVEKLFGDQVRADVLSHMIEHSYSDAVKQTGLRPVGPPEIVPETIETGKPLRYSATIDVLPTIEIADTSGLSAKRARREVGEGDVDRALDDLRESLAELRPVEDRTEARAGDFVSIDYRASAEGKPLPNGKRENFLVEIGKKQVPPEIEQALVGATIGQAQAVDAEFPADAGDAAIAGKTVRFDVTLRGIREKILPPADDELAKEHGEVSTLVELRQKIRDRIADQIRRSGDEQIREQIVDELLRRNAFEVPKSLVDRQIDALVEDILRRIGSEREAIERDAERLDKMREQFRPRAERQVRAVLALDALVEKNGIEIPDQDVEKRIAELAAQAGQQAARLREIYGEPGARQDLAARLARERALDAIVESAAIEEVEVALNVVAPGGETS